MFSRNNCQSSVWMFIIVTVTALTFTGLLAVSYFEFEHEKDDGQAVKMLRVAETVWGNEQQLCRTKQ